MNIAVNTRLLLKDRLEGLGNFTHEVLQRMVKNHPEHQFYFLFDRPYDASFIYAENVIPVVTGPPARHPVLFYAWFEWSVARALQKIKADIFLSPDGYLSLRSAVPQVPVIHDLNFHYYPEYFSRAIRKHYHYYFPRYARKAARIATVSGFSKKDIVQHYNIAPEKIDVVYNGARQDVLQLSEAEKSAVRQELTGGRPYFAFIGGLYPRKNLVNQLLAFELFKKQTGSETCFVLMGNRYAESQPVFDVIEQSEYREDIKILGRVEPREKADRILASSEALMYVSSFEGFGLPLVEAMRCGIPSVTGNITAMPEIAAGCGLMVSPFDVSEIATAMQQIEKDKQLQRQLVTNGYERLKEFTWEKTEAALWQSMMKALDYSPGKKK